MNTRRTILKNKFWKLSNKKAKIENKIEVFLRNVPFHWNHIFDILVEYLSSNKKLEDVLQELRTVERRPSFIH